MLEKIKKIQGINHTEFDETIQMWINAGKLDLKSIRHLTEYTEVKNGV